jgi:hypothetical protein
MAIFILGWPINRYSLGPSLLKHCLKDDETCEKKKQKEKGCRGSLFQSQQMQLHVC